MTDIAESVLPATPSAAGRERIAWRPVGLVATVVAAVHLAVAARYGWHRDEFYYVICGRHSAWGYADQPPLAPLLARLAAALPGGVLPLRVLAVAAQVGCVLLAPMLAAEFGGGRRAQTITAAAIAAAPAFVASSLLFGTTVLDQVAWVAVLVLVARALRLRTAGSWLAAGASAGVGLENKDTLAVLLLGVLVGLALLRREALRTAGPWLGGVMTLALAAPNVIWDAAHGWPNLRMAHSLAAEQGGQLGSLAQLPVLVLLAGPPMITLWVLGVRWLASPAGRAHRWVLVVAVVAVVAVVVFTASGGKAYYPAPVLAGLFAAGAVRVESTQWVADRAGGRVRGWGGLARPIGVSALAAVLIGLPVLPVSAASAIRVVNPTVVETYGWPGFVDQVRQAAAALPPGTPIFTSNYGEAGALTILGPGQGLRQPVLSAQNTYALWGPPPGRPDVALCVGEFGPAYLHRAWAEVTEVDPIRMNGVHDEETDHHAAIYVCRQPLGSWAQLWPALVHFD
ncbi:glycosyltransferase family 39 protein [Kitasatospora kifunensis]|uniref:Putative membrane protein n=1 Tax=Kitasatospora kifunensis TaxID=58351 RepID=A0A7W7RA53_KITKI|nr:glycosyltransferase family 39 protein [Kitasatospora kifunensis]MBB4927908.1 putative membrane protein [Kitasatospora kifunensis]